MKLSAKVCAKCGNWEKTADHWYQICIAHFPLLSAAVVVISLGLTCSQIKKLEDQYVQLNRPFISIVAIETQYIDKDGASGFDLILKNTGNIVAENVAVVTSTTSNQAAHSIQTTITFANMERDLEYPLKSKIELAFNEIGYLKILRRWSWFQNSITDSATAYFSCRIDQGKVICEGVSNELGIEKFGQ